MELKINSKGTKVLFLSDIHQEYDKAEKIIAAESPDRIVCLGDLFDSFYRLSEADVMGTINLYQKIVNNPANIMLFSNHDIGYHYGDNPTIGCSGFSRSKKAKINSIITPNEWDKIQWYCVVDDILCTHAGLSKTLVPEEYRANINSVCEFLDKEAIDANRYFRNRKSHWFWEAGQARGGRAPFGGILWNDFQYEYDPIPTIKSIMGHTSGTKVRAFNSVYKDHICIDSEMFEYLTITNGESKVHKYSDL